MADVLTQAEIERNFNVALEHIQFQMQTNPLREYGLTIFAFPKDGSPPMVFPLAGFKSRSEFMVACRLSFMAENVYHYFVFSETWVTRRIVKDVSELPPDYRPSKDPDRHDGLLAFCVTREKTIRQLFRIFRDKEKMTVRFEEEKSPHDPSVRSLRSSGLDQLLPPENLSDLMRQEAKSAMTLLGFQVDEVGKDEINEPAKH